MKTLACSSLLAMLLTVPILAAAGPDLNNDGSVDHADLAVMKSAFFGSDPRADLNGDGTVNFGDLALLRAAFDGADPLTSIAGGGLPAISLLPANQNVDLAQSFTLEVWMDFTVEPTIGGGFDVNFDPGALAFVAWEPEDFGDPDFRRAPDTDVPGLLAGFAFGDFDGLSGPALVGTLTFRAIQAVNTDVTPSDTDTLAGPFVSAVTLLQMAVGYVPANVDIVDVPLPRIDVAPQTLDFPATQVLEEETLNLLVSNDGEVDLSIGQIASIDMIASPFAIVADDCSLTVLAPSANCGLIVSFIPVAEGIVTESFDVPSDDPLRPSVSVSLSGQGLPLPPPDILVEPTELDFGQTMVGDTAGLDLTVRNVGERELVVTNLSLSNDLGAFSIGPDGCTLVFLAAGESCVITVNFDPPQSGLFAGSITIASNDPDAAPVVPLSGEGVVIPEPAIDVQPGTVQFPNERVGQTEPFDVTVSNTGTLDLVLGQIGGLDTPFSIGADGCSSATLAPSESCTITALFTPTARGEVFDSFDVPSNDPDDPIVTVDVSGRGQSVGMRLIGAPALTARCRNLTTEEQFDFPVGGVVIDCEEAGLVVGSGDRVGTGSYGVATGTAVQALAGGIEDTGIVARCRNDTTAQEVTFLANGPAFSCTAQGLVVEQGDRVIVNARGTAL